ncbi:MAG: nucleotide exchange factor GrpE [Bacteroidia bacterium]
MEKNQQTVDENEIENNDIKKESGPNVEPELESEQEDAVSRLEENLASEKDRYLRLVAEFENYKKRIFRERIELLKSAGEEIITSVIPVLDDFERAMQAGPLPGGIDLIYNKLVNILSQKGVKAMESKGKSFDADLHDALANSPAEDESMKNKIVDEIEKGYYLNDKVIRHAKVIVGN